MARRKDQLTPDETIFIGSLVDAEIDKVRGDAAKSVDELTAVCNLRAKLVRMGATTTQKPAAKRTYTRRTIVGGPGTAISGGNASEV